MLAPRRSRRGVLLLVVLSMLVLFMLIGTAFLMYAGQARDSAKGSAKLNRLDNLATKDIERALMQMLRDTENPASATHTHSLLRDYYGTDGFQGIVYTPPANVPFDPTFLPSQLTPGQVTRYAAAIPADNGTPIAEELGPTLGQFIDIYVVAVRASATTPLDPSHVVKLDRNVLGAPQRHVMPLTKGYYNGCLLTISGGAAKGQSSRILDYEFLGNLTPPTVQFSATQLFRFRVMAFGREDGSSLNIDRTTNHAPEITDLAGASFIVNGRPFNGTGVGYNPLAQAGQARLTALEIFSIPGSDPVAGELALLPNSRFFDPRSTVVGALSVPNQFTLIPTPATTIAFLHNPLGLYTGAPVLNYPAAVGPGDADEGYDAADFQNLFLALQTVTPRSQGRVITPDGTFAISQFLADPSSAGAFSRLDLEEVPLPSFHRPDLVNFWYHRLLALLVASGLDPNDAVAAIIEPYDPSTGAPNSLLSSPEQAALIVAIKRKIFMRPIREDHPKFDGGNPESIAFDYSQVDEFALGSNIAVPIWEIVGPWDVDNDNDGVNDSIWLDFGDPVQELEDGTRVKKLYAPLIIDMDSRLNANAHGLVDHLLPTTSPLNAAVDLDGNPTGNLAGNRSSDVIAQGLGMGPPETSLRPVFAQPWTRATGIRDFSLNRSEAVSRDDSVPTDDLACLMAGRELLDSTAVAGRDGYVPVDTTNGLGTPSFPNLLEATPGTNYQYQTNNPSPRTGEDAIPEVSIQLKLFDFPWTIAERSGYGTPADLMGRYALGLDYAGQPYYEVLNDVNQADNTLPRQLLTDSPYERDLSGKRRRAPSSQIYADVGTAFNDSLVQNDDATYSYSDLERVLRAWDADAGTLPSRLWDVVNAFDPSKLLQYDPARTLSYANDLFDPTNRGVALNSPEHLAAAQHLAGINRRLITTESAGPPVPSITPPAYLMTHADTYIRGSLNIRPPKTVAEMFEVRIRRENGMPTLYDEYDPNGNHDYGTDADVNSVDTDYSSAAEITNRLVRANRISAIISGGFWKDASNNPHAEAAVLAPEVIAGKRMDLNRPFGDGRDNDGDGLDNNNNGFIDEAGEAGDPGNKANGVVDEPLEAGDPYVDVNGNGKRDDDSVIGPKGEPYIDLDGNGAYSPPRDQLWQGLTAGESISFDYTQGHTMPLHPLVAQKLFGVVNVEIKAGIRNLESHARQEYARHLYCLMLLLVDEDYIAPWDDNDPQIKEYLDPTKGLAKDIQAKLTTDGHPAPAQETRRIMLRKLTCQAIAQWAINAVDMRDSDAIMTPFEFDENPWDGWGVQGRDGNLIPLDGDLSTDENGDITANETKVLDWSVILDTSVKTLMVVPAPQTGLQQTRNVVWGAERPELLITETVALHDRRTENLNVDFTQKTLGPTQNGDDNDLDQRLRPKGSLFVELYNPWSATGQYPAELYTLFNTRSATFSGFVDRNGDGTFDNNDIMGVELGRMSTFGAKEIGANSYLLTSEPAPAANPNKVRRSPVWRMIVVEEHPKYRQSPEVDAYDDNPDPLGTRVHAGDPDARYATGTKGFFEAADPDRLLGKFFSQGWPGPGKDIPGNEPYVERSIYFTSDDSTRLSRMDDDDPNGGNENFLSLNPTKIDDRLRLPAEFAYTDLAGNQFPRSARYFIASDASKVPEQPPFPNNFTDVPIAPIKPGRYAVIGTAGAQYIQYADPQNPAEQDKDLRTGSVADDSGVVATAPRYITTISRRLGTDANKTAETKDPDHLAQLALTRRIELRPHPNPEFQQVLVASNGGTPLFPRAVDLPTGTLPVTQRDNEVVCLPGTHKFLNIYDGDENDADGNPPAQINPQTPYEPSPDAELIPPCVAIPIKDMSVSEPLDLYQSRREALIGQPPGDPNNGQPELHYNPESGNGEGEFTNSAFGGGSPAAYDEPFDMAPELRRNGTTRNYRTIHLQRLADPTLPWNPMPKLPDGTDNPQHDAKLPVNLYRTIDSSSVDLTTYNGTSSDEIAEDAATVPDKEARWLPYDNGGQFASIYGLEDKHRIHMRSLERGAHATDTLALSTSLNLAARALWRQEPINLFGEMQTWLYIDPNQADPDQARMNELSKRAKEFRLRDSVVLDDDITTLPNLQLANGEYDWYSNYPDSLKPDPEHTAHFDFILDHSLGFANESFGAAISRVDLQSQNLPVSADGTPSIDSPNSTRHNPALTTPIDSTFPWLAWNNRPFVSASELLTVPNASSSQMLRQYSTIFGSMQSNPYDGVGIDPKNPADPNDDEAYTVARRLAAYLSPFGHLFSMFQTASFPAQVYSSTFPTPGGTPKLDSNNNWQFVGAPHYYRILDYVHTPSRFVGTDTMFTAEVFNDAAGPPNTSDDIYGPTDPRANFRPPFNKVSRERDPGKVNLNTVTARRLPPTPTQPAQIWSEVFDGLMHREKDHNSPQQMGHFGPAFRDVVLSRRGYLQIDAVGQNVDKPATPGTPDVFSMGLNPNSPTVFANPFRSPSAGDLVPLAGMVQPGIQASVLRGHPYDPGTDGAWGVAKQSPDVPASDDDEARLTNDPVRMVDDTREAGFGDDVPVPSASSFIPLFSERVDARFVDGNRNPNMYYQPMTRMENLVTNRSNVFAIWITVGYFEVEPAPNWNHPDSDTRLAIRARFGGTLDDSADETIAGLALYNRVYPDGYMLGSEVGSDTGNVKRPRGFFMVDRTEEVGFKPGEDLNVEKMIKLRRRIE